ncbi:MAG: hypothetical protein M1816_003631 [Peltula sp. TS41687]|nr:MAG: hypothetical protein M1816_003631 [Peltula sp. TS41687]
MRLSFAALLALSAAMALAVPVPGDSDELSKPEENGQVARSDRKALFACLYEFQRNQDPRNPLPSYKASIAHCQKWLAAQQAHEELQGQAPPMEIVEPEDGSEIATTEPAATEPVMENPNSFMSSLAHLPVIERIGQGIRKVYSQPFAVPGVPGGSAALRAFPI